MTEYFQELTKYFNELNKTSFPDTIIVSDLERLVVSSSVEGRDHLLTFIKLSAILTDFSHHFARQNQKASTLLVFSQLAPHKVKLLNNRLHQWYSEFWRVETTRIICESEF